MVCWFGVTLEFERTENALLHNPSKSGIPCFKTFFLSISWYIALRSPVLTLFSPVLLSFNFTRCYSHLFKVFPSVIHLYQVSKPPFKRVFPSVIHLYQVSQSPLQSFSFCHSLPGVSATFQEFFLLSFIFSRYPSHLFTVFSVLFMI